MGRQAALIALALATGCAQPSFGELLVVVDTDVGVPAFASRLRLDLYATDGTWYESREITVDDPSAWPLSFGLYTDESTGKAARVRLRLYPDGAVRDYRGEQAPGPPPFTPRTSESDLDALCTNAPILPPFTDYTARRGGALVTLHLPSADCPYMSADGSIAARVDIPRPDTYRFEVVRALPDGSRGFIGGDTILFLRTDCADRHSEVACNDDIDEFEENLLSRIIVPLVPGPHWLITGGKPEASPADLTLRWAPAAEWTVTTPSTPVTPPPALPRLVVDGVDATPTREPVPGRTIDRIFDVTIEYGRTRRVGLRLAGDCLGTAADLTEGTSCVDTTGVRAAFDPATLDDGDGDSHVGTWSGQQVVPCSTTPRTADPTTLDGQVCIPGGALTIGTDEISGVGDLDPSPRQVAVVGPLLLDANEVTVARYRKALQDGYLPPSGADFDQVVNDGPLARPDPRNGCAWNGDASGPAPGVDREHYPLNCISWRNARALCRFFGGDLPTHVQWEHAAVAAGRPAQTRYPWGDDDPDCDRAVFGRQGFGCTGDAPGPVAVDAMPWAQGDLTALGVSGLGGNVGEWSLDSFRPYRDACWWQHTLYDVGCTEPEPIQYSMRGGAWFDPKTSMLSALVIGQAPEFPSSSMGLRCAYAP